MPNLSTVHVYTDAGIIGTGYSKIGGSFAWRIVIGGRPGLNPCEGTVIKSGSGLFLVKGIPFPPELESVCDDSGLDGIECNLMETFSAYHGLNAALELGYVSVTLCCDNKNAIGRMTQDYATNNLPEWMLDCIQSTRSKFHDIKSVLMNGHPNKKELKSGIGHSGYPVSDHNVWCDKECTRIKKEFYALHIKGNQ